jgi:RNase adaptor protein for sRNA GlmZ degradation
VIDNLPLSLLEDLLSTSARQGSGTRPSPLALGIDSRTRGFDAKRLVEQINCSPASAFSDRDGVLRLCRKRASAPLF